MGYRKSAHTTYDLKYHLVWITKYRKPVLRGAVGLRARDLIRQTCATLNVEIIQGHVALTPFTEIRQVEVAGHGQDTSQG